MMSSEESLLHDLAHIVCNKPIKSSFSKCFSEQKGNSKPCNESEKCRISEKTNEQVEYILSDLNKNSFLKACPGSGKTEVVGLKTAYEIQKWKKRNSGIATLTFTNNATDVIKKRINQFSGLSNSPYPHYIGTLDSWLHGYIFNPFGHLITNYIPSENLNNGVQIIDNESTAKFLKEEYSTEYIYFERGNIQANQFFFSDANLENITFKSNDTIIDNHRNKNIQYLENLYQSQLVILEHCNYNQLMTPGDFLLLIKTLGCVGTCCRCGPVKTFKTVYDTGIYKLI